MEDLEEAWDFVKKEQLESEDEDDEMNPEQKCKELTEEDMGKANSALQAHMLIVAELKRKIEHKLYMAEAAATAGWGAVSVLENKMFTNVLGATKAEKEMKSQKIRKAMETYSKEQKLYKKVVPSDGLFKPKKRPCQYLGLGHKRCASKSLGYGGYDGYGGMTAAVGGQEGQGGYGQSYEGDGGYKGGNGYGSRRAGGSRGGTRPTRTCHRSVTC